jgi:importin subunit beta-1
LEQGFAPFASPFLQLLYPALQNHEDSQLCTVAIGLIGDITRALGDQSVQYAGAFMQVLHENLQSNVLNRNVKISILSCFGDIALAIGPAFEPFLANAVLVLLQAGSLEPNPVSDVLWLSIGSPADGISSTTTCSSTCLLSARAFSRRTPASLLASRAHRRVSYHPNDRVHAA